MFCKNCGNQLGPNSLFCIKCGTKVPVSPQAAPAQPAFTPPQPEIPAQPAFTLPQQPEIPAQPAFTPPQQPEIPAQPAFTPPQQPEIPAQPAFTPPQQPEIPAQPAFTPPPQPEIPAQPAFTAPQPAYPQQPAFQQQPYYASPAASAAPGSNADMIKDLMFFILLIMLGVLVFGLFYGPIVSGTSDQSDSESATVWTMVHTTYTRQYEILENKGEDSFISFKAINETVDIIFNNLSNLDHFSPKYRTYLIFDVIAIVIDLIAALAILIFIISSIVSFAKKKHPKAWSSLFVAWIFMLIAEIANFATAFAMKGLVTTASNDTINFHIILILSMVAVLICLVLTVMFKKRASTPIPSYASTNGMQYPMQ